MSAPVRRPLRTSALLAACAPLVLTACSTTITSQRVTRQEAQTQPGIYYLLPKTELLISVPVEVVTLTESVYEAYRRCQQACNAGLPNFEKKYCAVLTSKSISIKPAVITALAVPDETQMFRLSLPGNPFLSASHKVTLTETGTLTSAEASVSDATAEVAVGTLKLAASVVLPTVVPAPQTRPSDMREEKTNATSCRSIDDLPEFHTIRRLNRPIEALEEAIANAQQSASKDYQAEVANARAALQQLLDRFDLIGSSRKTSYRMIAAPIDPGQCAANGKACRTTITLSPERPFDAGTVQAWSQDKKELGSFTVELGIDPPPVAALSMSETCPPSSGSTSDNACAAKGYAYRIPRLTRVTVTSRSFPQCLPEPVTDCSWALADVRMPIAQFGTLAFLPAKYYGKGAEVGVTLSPATGALLGAKIGQMALPADVVTGPADALVDTAKARRAHRESATLQRLEAERDLLKLRKEIRDLEADLAKDSASP
jgi:hypothetical protein